MSEATLVSILQLASTLASLLKTISTDGTLQNLVDAARAEGRTIDLGDVQKAVDAMHAAGGKLEANLRAIEGAQPPTA